MKNVIVLLITVVAMTRVIAQSCLPEGLEIYSQEGIDNFQINYPGCTEIEGYVLIVGNNITNLNGLNVVTTIDGFLQLYSNDSLTNLTDLENLTSLGGLDLYDNAITNLSGLENLNFIVNDIIIMNNHSITNLSGLENVTSIGGGIIIKNNEAFTSLLELANLTSMSGIIEIADNDALTSLSGLDNIDVDSILIMEIHHNNSLSNCDIKSICDYMQIPAGIIEIHSNAPGCNSEAEVEAACLTTVEEIRTEDEITIIPNPAKDKITISSALITKNINLSIFNVNGEKVIELQLTYNETQLDISTLPRGVYFVRVQDENSVEVARLIKQ